MSHRSGETEGTLIAASAYVQRDRILGAFAAEAEQLTGSLRGISPDRWSLPTPCPPWTVAELLGHVLTTIAWLPGMIAAPAPVPVEARVTANGYYRPDERFSADVNAQRIDLGQQRAAVAGDGATLLAQFDAKWRECRELSMSQSAGRVVLTRHGDAMLLTDFLITRIVELGLHGLDLAYALGVPAWLSPAAQDVLVTVLRDDSRIDPVDAMGWDPLTFLRKATGRQPITEDETHQLAQLGVRWLTLG
jgi:uncharacterized protein (TIGR03083 family)